jgi:hypothetical protein
MNNSIKSALIRQLSPISILTSCLRSLYSPGVPKSFVDSFRATRHTSPASVSKKRVTRNDVAARAGVPPSTVSYVINNGPRSVSASARERVLEAISELGYHPSDVARACVLANHRAGHRDASTLLIGPAAEES